MRCEEVLYAKYSREPEGVAFCPYRVCPVGAHSDQNNGVVTGLAIDKGIHIAYAPKNNGVVEMHSLQFPKRAQWHIHAVPEQRENDWADHLRGATLMLAAKHPLKVGLCGVIEGTLPIGGLSSSAAVILAFLKALCSVNQIVLSNEELIQTALQAEKQYVGVSVGKLDQSCEVLSKKDHLLYLDTQDDSYELIPTHPSMKPYKIAVFFSGLERSLIGCQYNTRVDESWAAAYSLKAFAGIPYGKFGQDVLREVPYDVYLQHKDRLPESFAKRAEHWYTENARVRQAAEAWRRGDLEEYGRLSFESGHSSVHNWQSGSEQMIALYEIMTRTDGIYGGRFSGAGFKGCCIGLIDPAFEEPVIRQVTEAYLKAFPDLKDRFSVHICESADGVSYR